MSLFQNAVVTKYLQALNQDSINQKWNDFTTYFHNPERQENIRNSKEEQYQEGFLRELFVKILGYTLNPEPNFNLTTEYKNVKDSKKADGAIIVSEKVRAVIELKGTNTTDLGKIEAQAFGYKNNQPDCTYVITSNFEKIRFYIDNAIEHLEFNLFTLTEAEFKILYLCLAVENISKDIPKKIKNESVSKEDEITKELYKDYSLFKRELFKNLVELNPNFDQLELFKKSQKLLDRFLFIFFAEDRMLLPPNSVRLILQQWKQLQDLDEYTPLYERFKKYFGYLNTGYKGKNYDVYAYNGGLFKPDEILDNITIDDNLLYAHTLKLSEYDFVSEVDVNILGHIFENSLNELDEIKAQLEGQEIDKTKTKRKKDGVFYTPKYITKYIVENTIGKLCEEKKLELSINEEDYITDKKRQKKTIKDLVDKLDTYRKWLLQLTICDPACGSGAFLNQALDFLIEEHQYIDELQAKLFGDALVLTDMENSILENNLFGVDLNEESVEIAKLSLWLRTAQPNRKLNDLSGNIKCGNSLIDDPEIGGDKAFDWQNAFPKVFEKGGFDVIIGNPPYLRIQGLKDAYPELTSFYENRYISAKGNYDIYVLFDEKSIELINDYGIISFIQPHKFLVSDFGIGIRELFSKNKLVDSIIHFEEHLVFEVTTYTCILTLTKKDKQDFCFKHLNPKKINEPFEWNKLNYIDTTSQPWNLNSSSVGSFFKKLHNVNSNLGDFINIFSGIQTSGDTIYIIEGEEKNDLIYGYSRELNKNVIIEKQIVKQIIKGSDIKRYSNLKSNQYVIFPYDISDGKAQIIEEDVIKNKFPHCYEYLKLNEDTLRNREKGKMNHKNWYSYVYPKNLILSNKPKLVSPDITFGLNITKDDYPLCLKNGAYGIQILNKYNEFENFFMCLLNSNLLWFYLKSTGNVLRGGYFRFNTKYINPFPVPSLPHNISKYNEKAEEILLFNNNFNDLISKFNRAIQRKFELDSLPKKLESWYELTFAEFVKELGKKKIKLSLSEEAEWEDYFLQEQQKALALKQQITTTDQEIDKMVYELYGLTDEEIEIVENS